MSYCGSAALFAGKLCFSETSTFYFPAAQPQTHCDHGKAIKSQRLIIRQLSNDLPDQAEVRNRAAFHAEGLE